jgi:hypothetical protein
MSEIFLADPKLEDVPFEDVRDFYQLWLDMKAEHGKPQRKHFTPMMLKQHLPYVVLLDCEQDGSFKVRLVGTRYTEVIGFESTGMDVRELPGAAKMLERYRWLVENEKPYFASLDKMTWGKHDYRNYAIVGCPLYDDDGQVNMILFRVTFEKLEGQLPEGLPTLPGMVGDE